MKIAKHINLPPAGSNQLSTVLGKKLRAILRARKNTDGTKATVESAATAIGIAPGHLFYILQGRALPNEAVAARLLGWLRGQTYEGMGSPKQADKTGFGWELVKTKLPAVLVDKLRKECKRQGITIATLVHIAVERLVENRPFLATMAEAKKLVESKRMQQALQEVPSLREILYFDLALAKKIRTGSAESTSELQTPVERLINEPVLDLNEDLTSNWSEF